MKNFRLWSILVCSVFMAFTAKSQEQGFYILDTEIPSNITATGASLRGSFTASTAVTVGFQMRVD